MLSVSVEGDEEEGPLHLGCERACNVRGARRGMSALEEREGSVLLAAPERDVWDCYYVIFLLLVVFLALGVERHAW